MNQDYSPQIKPVESERAIEDIFKAQHTNPIILDFDETLWLRNSTATYLDSLRPHFLGFIIVILLKVIKPWCWLPFPFKGDKAKDWYLVMVSSILLPWSTLLWRSKAKKLAKKYSNRDIIRAVNANVNPPVIVATLGFNFIVNPLLQHLPIRHHKLIGCRFFQGASDRNSGKLAMVQKSISSKVIQSAVLVTDSEEDLPLLEAVATPCLCLWSSAKYIEPFQDLWLYRLMRKLKTIKYQRSTKPVASEQLIP